MKILFITARLPYPLLRGDQLRAYHQLRLLSRRHRVTLLSFAASPLPDEALRALSPFCERIVTVAPSWAGMMGSAFRALLSPTPLQAAVYASEPMRHAVRSLRTAGDFDLVHVQLARMAAYLDDAPGPGPGQVIDFIDALSLNMDRRAQRDGWPLSVVSRFEARRLRTYEREACARADRALVASAVDHEWLGGGPAIETVTNGVDVESFAFESRMPAEPRLIFSGNMGYFPNVDAALWFVRHVWPIVRSTVPQATLAVVGARPTRAVSNLVRHSGVLVTGLVGRVEDHLRTARVAVAPMRTGSGQQLKVLEAMATGTPVVASPFAVAGIRARDEEHVLVADDPPDFAAKVVRVLRDDVLARRLAGNGRALVEAHYTWEHSVAELERVYESVQSERQAALISTLSAHGRG